MSDRSVKALVIAGLLAQAAAVGLGFTAAGWRWPLAGVTALIAAVIAGTAKWGDDLGSWLVGFAVVAIAASAWHALSPSPVSVWLLWGAFGLEALLQAAILLFLLTFKMKRLW